MRGPIENTRQSHINGVSLRSLIPQSQPLVKDCQFGVSPVNYSDSDSYYIKYFPLLKTNALHRITNHNFRYLSMSEFVGGPYGSLASKCDIHITNIEIIIITTLVKLLAFLNYRLV